MTRQGEIRDILSVLFDRLWCFLRRHHGTPVIQIGVGIQCLDCGKFWSNNKIKGLPNAN